MEERTCKKCGAVLRENAGFCSVCGTAVTNEETVVISDNRPENKFCTSCGAPRKPEAVFCSKCRARVETPVNSINLFSQNSASSAINDNWNSPKNKLSKFSRILLIVLAVLLFGEALIACFVRPGWLRKKSRSGGDSSYSDDGFDILSDNDDGYLVGIGDKVGHNSDFRDTPAVSTETLTIPEDGSAVTAECGAVIELGAHNAASVSEITITKYEPDTEFLTGGTRCCYEIDAGDVHKFDYYFDIRLPYDPETADPDNEAGTVFAEYLNEETNKWELIVYDLDTEKHEVVIHTDHLSKYAPVTVKNGKTIYPLISTYENIYMDDKEAMNEIKMIMNKDITEMKEDPLVQSFFYYMLYNAPLNILNSYASLNEKNTFSYDPQYQVFIAGDLKDSNEINFWTSWISTIAADATSYFDMFQGEFKKYGKSYTPSEISNCFAKISTYLSAVTLIEKSLNADNNYKPDQATLKEMYEFLATFYAGELMSIIGVPMGCTILIPALLIEYGLDRIRNKLQDALDNSMARAVHEYYLYQNLRPFLQTNEEPYISEITGEIFKDKGVKKASWETLITKAYQENIAKYQGDSDRLKAVIDAGLNAEAAKAYEALLYAQNSGQADVEAMLNEKALNISSIKDLSDADREAVIEKVKLLFIKDIDEKGVMLRVSENIRTDMRQKLADVTNVLRDGFEFTHTLIIEENIPEKEKSQYAGCRVEFLSSMNSNQQENSGPQVVWKGKLDEKGHLEFKFSTYGYILSGMPDRLRVYSKDSNEIAVDTTFKVNKESIKITLNQKIEKGHWELESTYTYRSENTDPRDDEALGWHHRRKTYEAQPGHYDIKLEDDYGLLDQRTADLSIPPDKLVPDETITISCKLETAPYKNFNESFNVKIIADPVIENDMISSGAELGSIVFTMKDSNPYKDEADIIIKNNAQLNTNKVAIYYRMSDGVEKMNALSTAFVYKWIEE